jgi:GNAT superfamily N-acetyltransferase
MDRFELKKGYTPGAIGRMTELHAAYYSKHWGFDVFFESKVATELSELVNRFNESRDGLWLASLDHRIIGSIAIDGKDRKGARLRFFIVDPEYRGRGYGRMLVAAAIGFCRTAGFKKVYLSTFAGLDPARHLYEKFGFVLSEASEGNHWGKNVLEQTFELML